MSSISQLQDERKRKLELLRIKRQKTSSSTSSTTATSTTVEQILSKPIVKSRNFDRINQKPIDSFDLLPKSTSNNNTLNSGDNDSNDINAISSKLQSEILSKYETMAKSIIKQVNGENDDGFNPGDVGGDDADDDELINEFEEDLADDLKMLSEKTNLVIKKTVKDRLTKKIIENGNSADDKM